MGIKSSLILFVVLIMVLFVGITANNSNGLTYSDVRGGNIIGNTNGNISNNAFVARQNGWLFCQEGFHAFAFNIYNDDKVELGRKSGDNLNVVGELMFFTRYEGFGGFSSPTLYCRNLITNKICKIKEICTHRFIVYDGWIYYKNCNSEPVNCLYKAKYDGSDVTKLTNFSVNEFNIVDNLIYAETNNVRVLTIDGEIIQSIEFDEELRKISKNKVLFIGNEMYFISGYQKQYGIAKIDIETLKYTQITYEQCNSFNIKNDWIYFVKDKDFKLYRIKTDGTGEQQIGDITVERRGINIIDEWIYVYNNEDRLWRIKADGSISEKIG